MNIIGIIPARMASTRFPNKPMKEIYGVPMIGHVYHRSMMCKTLSDVYVATCDQEIVEYIESIGGKAIMTSDKHERATDRAAEAMEKIEKSTGKKVDILLMIQGDEPMLRPEMLEEVVTPQIENKDIVVSNLMAQIKTVDEQNDPNTVKVVVDRNDYALYFSREPIPSWKKGGKNLRMLKQLGIISFQRDFLLNYNSMSQTPLEIAESVDMLRVLENGYKIKMVLTDIVSYGVDTPEDLLKVESLIKNDDLFQHYTK